MDDLPGSALDDMLVGCCREESSHWPRKRGGDAGPACLRSEIIWRYFSTQTFVSSRKGERERVIEIKIKNNNRSSLAKPVWRSREKKHEYEELTP